MSDHGGASIRMRARLGEDGLLQLVALIRHPMETGRRLDDSGRTVPSRYIEWLEVRRNDTPVVTGAWGTGVARNPSLRLALRGARSGDRIMLSWRDNRGDSDTLAITVA